ncbi:MAG: hypothetical protein F9K35_11025 [Burkholderiaceae bacterium]|nr:MAG: hypothetical protein F9K35_11025 [Burkholderiaceae bacterium]
MCDNPLRRYAPSPVSRIAAQFGKRDDAGGRAKPAPRRPLVWFAPPAGVLFFDPPPFSLPCQAPILATTTQLIPARSPFSAWG